MIYLKKIVKTIVALGIVWIIFAIGIHILRSRLMPLINAPLVDSFEFIAHRSGQSDHPGNTLDAMRSALTHGATILEMDINLSRDGKIVLFHDSTLDRTTDCHGRVTDKTLAELKTCDKGYYFSPQPSYSVQASDATANSDSGQYPLRGKGIKIPTLIEVFSEFPKTPMVIEMKYHGTSIARPFCQLIRKFGKQNQIIVGSFPKESLVAFRKSCPEVSTSASFIEAAQYILLEKIFLSGLLNPDYRALQLPVAFESARHHWLPGFQIITPSLIHTAHQNQLKVHAWTINDKNMMIKLIHSGIDGIMTDNPGLLRKTYNNIKALKK